ncbi:MAG: hypothetical protein DWQ01_08585 [Planctomycetota bacterium]|nr:MAG: hypothetical protein DWQ01_08585 [Planctomycetota bacterium]
MTEFTHEVVLKGKDQTGKAFRSAVGGVDRLISKVHSLTAIVDHGTNIAKKFSVGLVGMSRAMAKPIELAGIQEKAQEKMNGALQNMGVLTDENVNKLLSSASALQEVTTSGDESNIMIHTLMLRIGQLGVDQVPRATAAALDLAEAMNTNVVDAGRAIAKTLGSTTNLLADYGIQFDNTTRGAERYDAVMKALDSTVKGAAKAVAQTFPGRVQQLDNAWGDLLETIGFFITRSEAVNAAIDEAENAIAGWNTALNENVAIQGKFDSAVTSMVTDVVPRMIDGMAGILDAAESATQSIDRLGTNLHAFKQNPAAVAKEAANLLGIQLLRLAESSDRTDERFEALSQRMKALGFDYDGMEESSTKAGDSLREMADRLRFIGSDVAKVERAAKEATDRFASLDPILRDIFREDPLRATMEVVQDIQAAYTELSKAIPNEEMAKFRGEMYQLERLQGRISIEDMFARLVDLQGDMNNRLEEATEISINYFEIWGGPIREAVEAVTDLNYDLVENQLEMEENLVRIEEEYAEVVARAEELSFALEDSLIGGTLTGDFETAWEDAALRVEESWLSALLDPIFSAEGAVGQLAQVAIKPFQSVGKALNDALFQPLTQGFLKFIGLKSSVMAAEEVKEAATAKAQLITHVAATTTALASMIPAATTLATAAAIGSFGSALSAGPAAIAAVGEGLAAGQALAASVQVAGSVPGFADGGQVVERTLAWIGEDGVETIIPEEKPDRARELILDLLDRRPEILGGAEPASFPSSARVEKKPAQNVIHLHFDGIVAYGSDPRELAELISDQVDRMIGDRIGRI